MLRKAIKALSREFGYLQRKKRKLFWFFIREQERERYKLKKMKYHVTGFAFICIFSAVHSLKGPWTKLNRKMTAQDAMELTWDTLNHLFLNIWDEKNPTGNFQSINTFIEQ